MRVALILVAALYAECAPSTAQSTAEGNLVENAGFERVAGDLPVGWTLQDHLRPRGVAEVVRADSGGLMLSLRPNSRNDDPEQPFGLGQVFAVDASSTGEARLSAVLRSEGGARPVVLVLAMSSNDREVATGSLWHDGGTEPTRQSTTFVIPRDTAYLIVGAVVTGTRGEAWFDDVSVTLSRATDTEADVGSDPEQPLTASVHIDATKLGRSIPKGLFGTNLEWIDQANGLWDPEASRVRPELMEALSALGVSAIRFPGGVFADYYDWRNGVGPRRERPTSPHGSDAGRSPNAFGTDELLELTRELGAEPILQVNTVTGSAEQAAAWVSYCKRAGHPVRLWEIGNEPYMEPASERTRRSQMTPRDYANRFVTFARSMRDVDDAIELLAPAGRNFGRYQLVEDESWNRTLLRAAAADIDYLSLHNAYAPGLFFDDDAGFDQTYRALFAFPVLVEKNLRDVAADVRRYAPEHADRIRLAVTEWGPFFHVSPSSRWVDHTKTLGAAVYVAGVLHALMRVDEVELANFFKLTERGFMGWIGPDGNPKPTYYAFQLYSRHFGDRLVRVATESPRYDAEAVGFVDDVDDVPYLDSVAAVSERADKLFVALINRRLVGELDVSIRVEGFEPRPDAVLRTLTGPALDSNNGHELPRVPGVEWAPQIRSPRSSRLDEGEPGNVAIDESVLSRESESFSLRLPPHSITILEMTRRDRGGLE